MSPETRALAQAIAKHDNGDRYEGFESAHLSMAMDLIAALAAAGFDVQRRERRDPDAFSRRGTDRGIQARRIIYDTSPQRQPGAPYDRREEIEQ